MQQCVASGLLAAWLFWQPMHLLHSAAFCYIDVTFSYHVREWYLWRLSVAWRALQTVKVISLLSYTQPFHVTQLTFDKTLLSQNSLHHRGKCESIHDNTILKRDIIILYNNRGLTSCCQDLNNPLFDLNWLALLCVITKSVILFFFVFYTGQEFATWAELTASLAAHRRDALLR